MNENLKSSVNMKAVVTLKSLLAALDPPMEAIVALERRVEKMQLEQAALEGRLDQLTRMLEADVQRRAPISQTSPRRLAG